MSARWGVIADDVTGACDVGAEVRARGVDVALVLGVPRPHEIPRDADVVVVGLQTRTAPRDRAVADSVAAARALRDAGFPRWYQKYCSTFDSTAEGMIGPVAEALADEAGLRGSLGTPATPHSARTVYQGHLFVGDRLLSESPLAHHPLTPMTDPDLVRVLDAQTVGDVSLVPHASVSAGAEAVATAVAASTSTHLIVDATSESELEAIARAIACGDGFTRVVGGGAGLIAHLACLDGPSAAAAGALAHPTGAELTVVGSASTRTREQVTAAGGPTVTIDALEAEADSAATVTAAVAAVASQLAAGQRPLVSASHDPQALSAAQERLGVTRAAEAVERALAAVALAAVSELGVRRLLIAGGETSGSVTRALGITAMRLSTRVDPGVAWGISAATAAGGAPVAILLKSGNFGGVDLMTRAWESL